MFSVLEPTEAQRLKDEAFIEETRTSYVAPLLEELSEAIEGFEEMDYERRLAELVNLNEPYVGMGDCLLVGRYPFRLPVYAGVSLGSKVWIRCGDFNVERYVPRFNSDIVALVHDDDLRGGVSGFLHNEHDTFTSLPVSYRAALVAIYVEQNVICNFERDDAVRFVLGCGGLVPRRVAILPVNNSEGLTSGWLARIRDNKPPQSFGIELVSALRGTATAYAGMVWTLVKDSGETEIHRSTDRFDLAPKRSTNERTALAYAFVDSLYEQGIQIGRGHAMSWDDVAAQLRLKYGDRVRSYTGNNLRDGYRKFKQRQGEW